MNIDLPKPFYTWSWRIILAAWVGIEFLSILDDDPGETFTAHTRPLIQSHAIYQFLFLGFIGWVIYHYLIVRKKVKETT